MAPSSAYFFEEILIEILKRLPAKSLLRFRCVQKSWFNLIRDPYFIDVYSRVKKVKNKYLLFRIIDDRSKAMYSVRFDDKQCKVYCPWMDFRDHIWEHRDFHHIRCVTCNGLLCVSGFDGLVQHLYLWNPLIGKVRTVPKSPIPCDNPLTHVAADVAFGYLAKINDYYVIKTGIYYDTGGEPGATFVFVNVYSLGTNLWKTLTINNFSGSSSFKFLDDSVVVNSAAYWIGSKADSGEAIICFDIEKEILREIMLPKNGTFVTNLLEFGEKLYVWYWHKTLDTWVLEGEMKEDWTKKVTLDVNKIDITCQPVGFSNNGDLVLRIYSKDRHFFYDIKKAEMTKVVKDNLLRLPADSSLFMSVSDESLVLLGDDWIPLAIYEA